MTQGEGKGQKRGREAVEADSLLPSSSSDRVRSVSVAFYPSIPSSSPSFQTLGLLRLVLHSHVILFFRLPSICPFSLSLSASSTILLAKVLAFSFWFSPFLDGCVLPLLFLSAPSPTRAAFPPTPFAASPPPLPFSCAVFHPSSALELKGESDPYICPCTRRSRSDGGIRPSRRLSGVMEGA